MKTHKIQPGKHLSNVLHQCGSALIISAFFVVAFAIKRNLFPAGIIFYEGIFCAVGFTLLISLLNSQYHFVRVDSLLPALLMMLMFISLVPTILDRSVSVAVLNVIKECQKPCERQSINEMFLELYVRDGAAVDKRLREQLVSGNLIASDGQYSLTAQGDVTHEIIEIVSASFNLDERDTEKQGH